MTNNHVVEESTDITVTTFDGKEYPAKVVGTDPKTDLAVIKIEGESLPFISWSAQETIRGGRSGPGRGEPLWTDVVRHDGYYQRHGSGETSESRNMRILSRPTRRSIPAIPAGPL